MNPRPEVKSDPRRSLPAVDRLVRGLEALDSELPAWALREAARQVLDAERQRLGDGAAADLHAADKQKLIARALAGAADLARPHPQPVVNATGIILHTNLGRAPLAPEAARAVELAARTYGDLEIDLDSGNRSSRTAAAEEKLRLLSGAGGALVVNNNAAAVLLVLAGLAQGRAAIVSRGELVEIGGSFRIPEIIASAGVRLIEVGTSNRTYLRDYEAAIGPDTGLLLKVHRSNFTLRGFVAETSLAELAALADARGLPLVEDLGSSSLLDLTGRGLPEESWAPGRLARGAGLVCFSGDKLLGGPQAGIVLTREAELADRLRRHPLARALRMDKLSLAALDWTLSAHLDGRAEREIPVLRQLLAAPEDLRRRAGALAERLCASEGFSAVVSVEPDRSYAGGGSLPDHALDSWVVCVEAPAGAARLAARLREGRPPVLARVHDDRLILDVRTLLDGDEDAVVRALLEALR
jgi:L-seryl-tRNA(Ser) seleniumtransferase